MSACNPKERLDFIGYFQRDAAFAFKMMVSFGLHAVDADTSRMHFA
jgi:hypothetical protein